MLFCINAAQILRQGVKWIVFATAFCNRVSPQRTRFCSHKLWTSMWRTLPAPSRLEISKATLESMPKHACLLHLVTEKVLEPNGGGCACSPTRSTEPPEDIVTMLCMRLRALMVRCPNLITPPEVDFLVLLHPAKSVST